MGNIALIAQKFFYALSIGTFIFSILTPSHLTGAGFIRLVSGVCGASFLISSALYFSANELSLLSILVHLILGLIFVFQYFWHEDEKSPFMWVTYFVALGLGVSAPLLIEVLSWHDYIFFLSSIIFIGITNYAMILGHYYLVVPKLTESPLIKSMYILWAILGLKFLMSSYLAYENSHFFVSGTRLGQGYMFNWILLSFRFLWGYLALGILSYFGYKLAKIRSIQSATGVYYIMVFFILIGEIVSYYLSISYGLNV